MCIRDSHLNGIFGFAIWDENKKELFMARDHFGIKPFFYSFNNKNFIFASEIKAILQHPDISADVYKRQVLLCSRIHF